MTKDWKPPLPDENVLEGVWKNMGPWNKLFWTMSFLKKGKIVKAKKGKTVKAKEGGEIIIGKNVDKDLL